MKRTLLALTLSLVFAVPAFSQMGGAEMKGPKHGQGTMEPCAMDKMADMMGMCLKHAEKLGLSEDQVERISTVHRVMEKKHVRFDADVRIARMELMEITAVKDFDLALAEAKARNISELETTHHLEMLKAMKDVRTLLTEEQFKKMKKMMSDMADDKGAKKADKRHK